MVTDLYPEYIEEIENRVKDFLTLSWVEDENITREFIKGVKQETDTIIWDNTYNESSVCSIRELWGRLEHLIMIHNEIENIQDLKTIAIEIAALCFIRAWLTEKWNYLNWLVSKK